jgi:hypothetical protein
MKNKLFLAGMAVLVLSFGIALAACASRAETIPSNNESGSVVQQDKDETSAAATNGSSPGIYLDTAIKNAAVQMEENISGGTKVALVSIASSSAQFSEYVLSRLEAAIVSGRKLVIVDRANLDKVREEQGFQLSGEVDDDSAKAIGKLAGAGAIVTGVFTDLGDVYSLSLKAINIETATVAVSYPEDITKSTRIATLLASGGGVVASNRTPAQTTAQIVQTPAQTAPVQPQTEIAMTYKVGDRGPAGGLVFYSTATARSETTPPPPVNREYLSGETGPSGGVVFYPDVKTSSVFSPVTENYAVGTNGPANGTVFYSSTAIRTETVSPIVNREYNIGDTGPAGGIIFFINPLAGDWKYMEAAPANTEKVTFWAAEDFPSTTINNSRAVGTGKSNSNYIMGQAIDRGGGFDWATEVCDSLVVNGYDDWFLPSRDELHQMYGNLVRRGLGGFKGEWYWSSTANNNVGSWVWRENFTDGTQNEVYRYEKNRVRAIRQF